MPATKHNGNCRGRGLAVRAAGGVCARITSMLRPTDHPVSCSPCTNRDAELRFRFVECRVHEHTDAAHALLCAERQRPQRRYAAEPVWVHFRRIPPRRRRLVPRLCPPGILELSGEHHMSARVGSKWKSSPNGKDAALRSSFASYGIETGFAAGHGGWRVRDRAFCRWCSGDRPACDRKCTDSIAERQHTDGG